MVLKERDQLCRGNLDQNVDVEPPLSAGSHDRNQDAGVAEVLDRGLRVEGKVALRRMPLLERA
jgi:hypothetical protein